MRHELEQLLIPDAQPTCLDVKDSDTDKETELDINNVPATLFEHSAITPDVIKKAQKVLDIIKDYPDGLSNIELANEMTRRYGCKFHKLRIYRYIKILLSVNLIEKPCYGMYKIK